jgi:GH43 family beta-xylosidase
MKRLLVWVVICALVFEQGFGSAVAGLGGKVSERTFRNPLLPSGPDPWVTSKEGWYYFMASTQTNLMIWKTRNIPDLKNAEKKAVWTPPPNGPYSAELWAPELHFLRGKWYIYFAADAGDNSTHRLWVLENGAADPLQGEWMMKGKLADASDKWAIDASVFELNDKLYALWSGWEDDTNGVQNIYIAAMSNPWTISGRRVLLSSPTLPWETIGDLSGKPSHVDVNEGPEVLVHGDKIFLFYSASGCWTDRYCLGMLSALVTNDLLERSAWKKSLVPVFWEKPSAHAYGTGHNSFFKSPDGTEDWLIYHANPEPGDGCGRQRSPRTQRFEWNADGTPNFGEPVPLEQTIERPSGE